MAANRPVTLNVDTAPTVTLIAPVNGTVAKAPASFTLTADANDVDGNLATVAFYANGTLIQSVSAPSNSIPWNNVAKGSYVLTAVATDSFGIKTVSDPVSVTVKPAELSLYYIQSDQLNTPRLITDANNNAVWEDLPGEPFGESAPEEDPNQTGSPFVFNLRFPGQYHDSESGLSYNLNRDYDPSLGRYTESDPLGLVAGVNTYTYVDGNPVGRKDKKGLDSFPFIPDAGWQPPPPWIEPNPNLELCCDESKLKQCTPPAAYAGLDLGICGESKNGSSCISALTNLVSSAYCVHQACRLVLVGHCHKPCKK